jgi:hypothetical protein
MEFVIFKRFIGPIIDRAAVGHVAQDGSKSRMGYFLDRIAGIGH